MKFVQIIEFKTSQLDEFNAVLDAAIARSQGRTPHRVVFTKDRDSENLYALVLEFPSREKAMENSNRPESAAFAASLATLCDSPLQFRNLDLLREEDL
jgi:quinol monooxygenase YgiN